MPSDKLLRPFVVIYDEPITIPIRHWLIFTCMAEDADHAEEQCLNAYPTCGVLWVYEGDNVDDALNDFYYSAS